MGQLRVEIAECELNWRDYPALDRLTDAITHEGSDDIKPHVSDEV